jgi:hypothetical protein
MICATPGVGGGNRHEARGTDPTETDRMALLEYLKTY